MTYLKPLPDITVANRPFWDGLAGHRFLVPRCQSCGDFNWVPYPACRTCLSEDQVWTEVSGDATVYSYTVVERGHGPFNEEAPYAVVLAKLAEEPRACIVLGNTRGIANGDLHVGLPVRITYEDIPGGGCDIVAVRTGGFLTVAATATAATATATRPPKGRL